MKTRFLNKFIIKILLIFFLSILFMLKTFNSEEFKQTIHIVWVAFFLISIEYLSINYNPPKGLTFLLNAGFKRWEIIVYLGGNYIILSLMVMLFVSPPLSTPSIVIYLLFLSYMLLILFLWLLYGINIVILLSVLPVLINFAIIIFFKTLFHWDFYDFIEHSLLTQITLTLICLIFAIYFLKRFLYGDIT